MTTAAIAAPMRSQLVPPDTGSGSTFSKSMTTVLSAWWPAASLAMMVKVFSPFSSVALWVNRPSAPTVTAAPLTVADRVHA